MYAQEAAKTKSDIQFGIKAGLNATTTSDGFGSGALFKDPNYKAGLILGGFVRMPIGSNLTLHPSWFIQQKVLYKMVSMAM